MIFLTLGIVALCVGILELVDFQYSAELTITHNKEPTLRHLLPLAIYIDCMCQRAKVKKAEQDI